MPTQAERRVSKRASAQPSDDTAKVPDHPEDKANMICGVVAAVLLLVGSVAFLLLFAGSTAQSHITRLDSEDHASVKEVLFGGDPWLIYCVDNETAHHPVSPLLTEKGGSAALLKELGMKTGVLDCYTPMPSGKTIAQKFLWGTERPPFAFAVANAEPPLKVSLRTKTPAELVKRVKPVLSAKITTIDSIQKWPTACTGRRACLVLGHKSKPAREGVVELFAPLLEKHRSLKVVTVDTAFWALRLGAAIAEKRPQMKIAKPNDLDVVCLARREGVKDKKSVHLGGYLQSLDGADSFMAECAQQQGLLPLGVQPMIGAKQTRREESEVIEAEPLPSDFFKEDKR